MSEFLSREKLLSVKNHRHFNLGLAILIFLLVADLLFLNFKILALPSSPIVSIFQEKSDTMLPEGSIAKEPVDSCGEVCMAEINKAVSAVNSVKKGTSGSSSTNLSSPPGPQEYFIPLGSGVISNTTLQTITGMQATVDGNAYGSGYTATFEISVNVPTGNETATFQLYNSTLNQPVWNSVVNFTTGGTPALLVSSPITLSPGSNTYVVQGQTQLQFPAYITQARIHVITK